MKFFNTKKNESKIAHQEFLNLIKKWEFFLTKIETSFNESLIQVEGTVLENLVLSNYDLLPTRKSWQIEKSQLMILLRKIEETFENLVKPQMLIYKESYDIINEDQKGIKLSESIYYKIERFEIILEGKIAQQFYNRAILFLNKDFKCIKCSSEIKIKKDIFRANNISCNYCHTVNIFTPKSKINGIYGTVDLIAKYNALEEWDKLQQSKQEFNEISSSLENEVHTEYINRFKKREQTERTYWAKFLKERIKILPEFKETLEYDIDIKMKWFYKERKQLLNY